MLSRSTTSTRGSNFFGSKISDEEKSCVRGGGIGCLDRLRHVASLVHAQSCQCGRSSRFGKYLCRPDTARLRDAGLYRNCKLRQEGQPRNGSPRYGRRRRSLAIQRRAPPNPAAERLKRYECSCSQANSQIVECPPWLKSHDTRPSRRPIKSDSGKQSRQSLKSRKDAVRCGDIRAQRDIASIDPRDSQAQRLAADHVGKL